MRKSKKEKLVFDYSEEDLAKERGYNTDFNSWPLRFPIFDVGAAKKRKEKKKKEPK